MDTRRLEKLRRRLFNGIPLLGGWWRRRAARILARDGSREAIHLLAQTATATETPAAIRTAAGDALRRLDTPRAIDSFCAEWAATRHEDLARLLGERGWVAAQPAEVRLLTALKLGRWEVIDGIGPPGMRPLVQACHDADPDIAHRAHRAARQLTDPGMIQTLCDWWSLTRDPFLEQLLLEGRHVAPSPPARLPSALKVGERGVLRGLGPDALPGLLAALEDRDPVIAEQAHLLVGELTAPETRTALVDPLCARWVQSRDGRLEAFLVGNRFIASGPPEVRLLTALKTGQPELLGEADAADVPLLLRVAADTDPAIAAGAWTLLRTLSDPLAREAVCHLFLEQNDEQARAIAVEAGYLPRDEGRRALFLFLTEQWERYEVLDFDRRLLTAAHEAAGPTLRGRITEKLRAAGRTDFLTVLAGHDFRSRAARMAPGEADFLVQMLTAHREWPRLWTLAFELNLRASVRIVRTLAESGWRPAREDDRVTFVRLAELASGAIAEDESLTRQLPPAVQRARVRVSGRVNDVAFSPRRPLIAIGTGRRKLVLWDFQKGQRGQVLGGFDHSIGRVAFSRDDTLWCAERTRHNETGTLHAWRGKERFSLRQTEPVTALEPVGESLLLVTRRDGRVFLADAGQEKAVHKERFRFWCRSARVRPDGGQAALLHESVTLVGLPGLDRQAHTARGARRGVISCAAFVGPEAALVVGYHHGTAAACVRRGDQLYPESAALVQHEHALRCMEVVAGGTVILTASVDGLVAFTAWANRAPLGRIQAEGKRLTSLHVSPDGAFLALGDSDATMSLWDLRALEAPLLVIQPFARALPIHLAAVNLLAEKEDLPATVRQAMRFVQCVLQHRFRFDIEIVEAATIQRGEFDIEIE